MEKTIEIILYFISMCLLALSQSYTIHFLSSLISKTKYSHKKLVLGFVLLIPIAIIAAWIYNNYPDLSSIKLGIGLASFALIAYFIYKVNILKAILITVIGSVLHFLSDIPAVLVVSLLFKDIDSMEEILQNKTIYYLINIITNILYLAILKLVNFIIHKKNLLSIKQLKNVNYKIILYQGIVIIITLIPSMYLIFYNNYDYPLTFVIINTLQLIIVSIFSFLYMEKRTLFKDTELELENTKLHNKALATINESIRGFKHDMGNMVQAINGYISVGNIAGVKNYCKNLLQGFNDINLLSILSPKVITDPAIYGVVVSKMLYARDNNLTLSLDIGVDVSNINFPTFELSRIIGILLDNAIEAALESDERKIKLEMCYDDKKKADIIIIGNSVKDIEKLDIIKMFEKDYSTKENPSGFGLYEVLKFLKKNNKGDIVPNVDYDNNFFTQTLTFDK